MYVFVICYPFEYLNVLKTNNRVLYLNRTLAAAVKYLPKKNLPTSNYYAQDPVIISQDN